MKKVTVQLNKLLLEEGISRRKENSYSYSPCVFSKEFKSSNVIQSMFKVCLSVILSVFECNLKYETV